MYLIKKKLTALLPSSLLSQTMARSSSQSLRLNRPQNIWSFLSPDTEKKV